MGPNCCLYRSSIVRDGLPNCGDCRVAKAFHDLAPDNLEAFDLFNRYLQNAITNPFPFAEKPVLLLDMAQVRLCLEAEQVPVEDWPDMIVKFKVLFDAREHTRP